MEMETHNHYLNQELCHFQSLFSSHFDSDVPPLPLADAQAAPVFVRGRRYALYAEKREARIRQRLARATYSPLPPPARKKVSFDHDAGHGRVLQRVENELMRSVPDFSSLRKENKKPVPGSPLTSFRTPPKSPGIGLPSRNACGIRAKKEVGLVSRSYASMKELKGFSSPSQQSLGGGRVRGAGLRGGY